MALIKGFYDTRSRLVHGGELNQKHRTRLANIEVLRSHLRRLLKAFVGFAARQQQGRFNRKILAEQLDGILVNAAARDNLRAEFGFDRN
jgi:hypothetical protein